MIALRNACQAGLKKIRQYWERAEEARKSSDYQSALSLLNEVLHGVAPEDPGTIERLNRIKSEVKELSAALAEMDRAWQNKSYNNCLAAADRILSIQPKHSKAQHCKLACTDKIQAIQGYVKKAEGYYQNQQYDEAVAAYEQTKRYYYLGKCSAVDVAEVETQHGAYSPEYQEILHRIAVLRRAKRSMEQALDRAKERLEAGDLVETRLALNDYFELQTNGEEGLQLQQKLESLHQRATRKKRIRRSVTFLTVAAVISLGLTYGVASLIVSLKMQRELEKSWVVLTFANLKDKQRQAGLQLDKVQQSRLTSFFSVEKRWKQWHENLNNSGSAWKLYSRGEYEEGQREIENMPPTEFKPWIQHAFDAFVQDTNGQYADANDALVKGKYDNCIADCNEFLIDYPQHRLILDLLQKAKKAGELERFVYDPNIDLRSLSRHLHALNEISPRHDNKRQLEEQCIKRVESKYGFPDTLLPADVNDIEDLNDIEKQMGLCKKAFEDLALFEQCYSHDTLHITLTKRQEDLESRRVSIEKDKEFHGNLAKVDNLIEQRCWGRARDILDILDPARKEVVQRRNKVAENMAQIEILIKRTEEQVKQKNWLDAHEILSEAWSLWNKDDTWDLLEKANPLENKINEYMQRGNEDICAFIETMDQKDHAQIEKFVIELVGLNYDLTPVYTKWLPRLYQDAQNAEAQNKITTALNLLNLVLDNEKIISDADKESFDVLLQNLRASKELAEKKSNRALERTSKAIALQNKKCAEALWYIHQALKMNYECKSAHNLQEDLQRRERVATQFWQEARMLYDDRCYFNARLNVKRADERFPGDFHVTALSHDLDVKIEAASQAVENVLSRKTSVKEFYDTYADYGFDSEIDQRLKKAILRDLKDRIENRSEEKRRSIIIAARERSLRDEKEYKDLQKKYSSGATPPLSSSVSTSNPGWCQIYFGPPPEGNDVTIYIEGHGLRAFGTVFVRCHGNVSIRVIKTSDPDRSRTQALHFQPWKVYRIKIKPSCLDMKTANVQVVRKGWLFKGYDLDAMADQILKEYQKEDQIDKSLATKSLQAAMKDNKNAKTLRVPLIGHWQEEKFLEVEVGDE